MIRFPMRIYATFVIFVALVFAIVAAGASYVSGVLEGHVKSLLKKEANYREASNHSS
jgi:hypothetical protein